MAIGEGNESDGLQAHFTSGRRRPFDFAADSALLHVESTAVGQDLGRERCERFVVDEEPDYAPVGTIENALAAPREAVRMLAVYDRPVFEEAV